MQTKPPITTPGSSCSWCQISQVSTHSGTHLDFRVDNGTDAAQAIVEIGGAVIKPPDTYIIDGEAMLEWAVMEDPFGNEFCIIRWPLDQT